MRNLKKFLALVLALMMTFSLMVTVNAADPMKDVKDVHDNFSEAVQVLNGMGVFRGYEDGTFRPNRTITRAEAATIVYRLATADTDDSMVHLFEDSAVKQFVDVAADHWAAGYIGYCVNNGLVVGYDDTHFGPSDKVTGVQVLAMILRAVGYGQNKEFEGPAWATNVYGVARAKGLLANVDKTSYSGKLTQDAPRELIAELLFQAAQIPTVTYTMLGGYNEHPSLLGNDKDKDGNPVYNPSLAVANFGLADTTGVIVGNQATGEASTILAADLSHAQDDIEESDYILAFDTVTSVDKFGCKTKVWYKEGTDKVYASINQAKKIDLVYCIESDVTATTAGTLGKVISNAGFSVGEGTAYESDAFGTISSDKVASTVTNTDGDSNVYLLISNSNPVGGKYPLDLIVALDVDVMRITAKNDYTNPKTVTIGSGEGRIVAERSDVDLVAADKLLVYGEDDIAVGARVVVNAIAGTNKDQTDKNGGDITLSEAKPYIGINKLTEVKSGKVTGITSAGKVTLDTGDVLEPSVLYPVVGESPSLLIGASLTFTLDGYGKYVYAEPGSNDPFMGVYGYWEQTGISGIKYYIQGVTRKGVEIKEEISQKAYQEQFTGTGVVNKMPYLSTTAAGSTTTSLTVTQAAAGQWGYADLVVDNTKMADDAGWSAFPANPAKLTLSKGDDRFQVGDQTKYLTDSTVYHVVTGYGDNLKIEHFTGLTALLQGADSIEFNGYYFQKEDDSEHTAGKNGVVEEALLVNVKRISTSNFFFNLEALEALNGLKKTVDKKALQYSMFAAGESEDGYLLVSRIDSDYVMEDEAANETVYTLTKDTTFYLAGKDADGYYELIAVPNSDPAGAKTFAYYSYYNPEDENDDTGILVKGSTAFGDIKFTDAKGNLVVLKAGDAKVIDVSENAKTNGIKDYETLRRATEENKIKVAVLVTTAGGNTATVVYVTSAEPR